MMMSSLYIEIWYSPPTCIAQHAKNIADMQSFEEAMAWGAVTFVKYVDKYVTN